jgi:hypothetical protein
MRIGRTILALLIALSVAMLPAAASAGAGSKSPGSVEMSSDMSAPDMSAMADDCCPHKANPCDEAGDCGTMATCVLKCFSFADASPSTIVFPSSLTTPAAPVVVDPLPSHTGSPPFRPPRA